MTGAGCYYRKSKRDHIEVEDEDLVILGEDPDPEDGSDEKPIRELDSFVIFDPKHRNELVTLDALEQDDGLDRQFEAVGHVRPYFLSDEDEGQEDDVEAPQIVHLSAILRFTVNYTEDTEYVPIPIYSICFFFKAKLSPGHSILRRSTPGMS